MRSSILPVVAFLLAAGTAIACQVPVFRYAFEQWSPDQYHVLILTDSDKKKLDTLVDELGLGKELSKRANVEMEVVTPDTSPTAARLWKKHNIDGEPIAVTFFPSRAKGIGGSVAHVGPASPDGLKGIVDSKVRREVSKRLVQGESAVWILLESGDQKKDDEARAILEKQLAEDAKWLELPAPQEMEIKPEVLDKVKVKLRVDFSIISLSADDPDEQFLVNALLNSEEDLRQFDEPIAFPIFGRGLVLYALVGKGIASDNIRGASKFICGPCSCQVKEQNPGFDMLMQHDWDVAVGDVKISSPLPTSSSVPELVPIPSGRASR